MRSLLHRGFGLAVDQVLCGTLAILHRRHAGRVTTRDAAEKYFSACERQTRAEYFALPPGMEAYSRKRRGPSAGGVPPRQCRSFRPTVAPAPSFIVSVRMLLRSSCYMH